MKQIIDIYKALGSGEKLLPTSTGFIWWESVYTANASVYDREFARKYCDFRYYDFLHAEEMSDIKANLKADILSILTFNQKKYAEMYRIFVVADEDDPITYNYDMTETTGAQHTENTYADKDMVYGATQYTEGQQIDTHATAPMNSTTPITDSSDTKGQRIDSTIQHTDTEKGRTDEYDSNEWTLTRRGNIGVQTAGDIMRIHTDYWTNHFKFMDMIFDDINKELLMVE